MKCKYFAKVIYKQFLREGFSQNLIIGRNSAKEAAQRITSNGIIMLKI
jgi:hypothetical protein